LPLSVPVALKVRCGSFSARTAFSASSAARCCSASVRSSGRSCRAERRAACTVGLSSCGLVRSSVSTTSVVPRSPPTARSKASCARSR